MKTIGDWSDRDLLICLTSLAASVRTEAGFIFLMLSSVYLLLSAIRPQQLQRPRRIAAAGLVGGAAYLYRTEAVGLPIVIGVVLLLGPAIWRELNFKSALIAFL